MPGVLRSELALWVGATTALAFLIFGDSWLSDLSNLLWYNFLFSWAFASMLWLAFGVVRHADALAIKLGEPYGTIILTLAVTGIEVVMIATVMLTGQDNPTLARDTLFSVLMIVLNGMVGLTLLLGGLQHGEQSYNLRGAADTFSALIGGDPNVGESTIPGQPFLRTVDNTLAFPADASADPHLTGLIYAGANWDLIEDLDAEIFADTLLAGLPFLPSSPSAPDYRDAIVQGDQVLTGGINAATIQAAFADHGSRRSSRASWPTGSPYSA